MLIRQRTPGKGTPCAGPTRVRTPVLMAKSQARKIIDWKMLVKSSVALTISSQMNGLKVTVAIEILIECQWKLKNASSVLVLDY
jgi:hypothetical protein